MAAGTRGRQATRRVLRAVVRWVVAPAVLLVALHVGLQPAAAHTPHDNVADIAVSPAFAEDGTAFAIVRNRLMRSTDGGATWAELVNGLGAGRHALERIAVAPSDEQVTYLATRGGGVLRSADGGTSWSPVNRGLTNLSVSQIAVSPRSPEVVLAAGGGDDGGLFVTTDGGGSWSPMPTVGRVTSLAFLPDGHRVVIGLQRGLVVTSDDLGRTTTPVLRIEDGAPSAIATASRSVPGTVFVATGTGRVFRSDDAGGSFVAVGGGLPREEVRSIALSPGYSEDTTLWASTSATGVFRSTDGGSTWEAMSDGLTTDPQADDHGLPQFRTVAAGATAGGDPTLFVGGFDGLFRLHDGSSRWDEVETLADYIVGLAVSPDFAEDGTIAVTSYVKGVFLSRDGGETWSLANRGVTTDGRGGGTKFAPLRRMHNVMFSPDYADDGTIFSADWAQLVRSTDRGGSWTDVPMGSAPGDDPLRQFVLAASPAYSSDRTVFAGTRHGEIFRSEGGGEAGTWTKLADLGERVRSLAVSPDYAHDRVIYAGTVTGVHTSRDGGTTWEATGPTMATTADGVDPESAALVAVPPNHGADGTVFAGTNSGLFVSRDAGGTWTEVVGPPLTDASHVEAVAVSPDYAEDGTVLASTRDLGLLRSTDGGASFTAVARDLVEDQHLIADFDNPTSSPIQFSPAFASDGTVFAYAQTVALRSTDGGRSWDVLDLPAAAAVASSLERGSAADRAGGGHWFETPAGNLSARRLQLAAATAIGCFVALSVLGVGGGRTGRAVTLRAVPSVLVLAAALVLLAA